MFPLPPLTDEQRSRGRSRGHLSRERFAPRAARYDADSTFPYENYADLHAAGLFALTVPREYGGVGADPVTYVHALREIAKGCSATALTFDMHSTVTTFVAALGTEERSGATSARSSAAGPASPRSPASPSRASATSSCSTPCFTRAMAGATGWRG